MLLSDKQQQCMLVTPADTTPSVCPVSCALQTIADPTLKKNPNGGSGDDFEPLPTVVPVPAELNRTMLAVRFLCRAMREIQFQTAVPDRVVGVSGGGNYQVRYNTFSDVLRLIGRFNLGIPFSASYSMRNIRVTQLFQRARQLQIAGKWGEAQDLLAAGTSGNVNAYVV